MPAEVDASAAGSVTGAAAAADAAATAALAVSCTAGAGTAISLTICSPWAGVRGAAAGSVTAVPVTKSEAAATSGCFGVTVSSVAPAVQGI